MRGRSGARVLNETRVRVARFGGFSVRLRLIGILIRNLTNSKDDFDNLSIYVRIVYIDFYNGKWVTSQISDFQYLI